MKRIITASRHSSIAEHYIGYIPELADTLSKVALSSSDEEAVQLAQSKVSAKNISTKSQALKAVWQTLQFAMRDYLESSEVSDNILSVTTTVLDACEKATGHASYPFTGVENSYVIDDDADYNEFEDVCRYVQNKLKVKDRDGAMLGGSWTAHNYVLDSVPFKISYSFNKIVLTIDE